MAGHAVHQLTYTLAVAEEHSFTRAADRLHLAQTVAIAPGAAARAELGVQLWPAVRARAR